MFGGFFLLVLHAYNIKKSYGDRVIVQLDDLRVHYGEKIGIVGAFKENEKQLGRLSGT